MTELSDDYAGILDPDVERTAGDDARTSNVEAGIALAEAVRTTLGPNGMDKMLVDATGMAVVTNSGASIVGEMDIDHPVAGRVADAALAQNDEVGDGTTTTVILAGELLSGAEALLDRGLHPTTVVGGYRRALSRAVDVLDAMAIPIDVDDDEPLTDVAATAMAGRATPRIDRLASLVVEAVRAVADDEGVRVADVALENAPGGTVGASELLRSVVIDKERARGGMPRGVTDARVAVFEGQIGAGEISHDWETAGSVGFQIVQHEAGRDEEAVDRLVDLGVDAVICEKGIAEGVLDGLSRRGIYAVRNVASEDIDRVSRATGARVLADLGDVTADALGTADAVVETTLARERRTRIDVDSGPAATFVVRGGTLTVVQEAHRAVEDGLEAVRVALEDGRVLPGGGAAETELARELREFSASVGTREGLAVEAFADAVEVVPRTLAENAGASPIDAVLDLRRRHAAGEGRAGIDAYEGDVVDVEALGVLDPIRTKHRALTRATEIATMVLRIDDVVAATTERTAEDIDPADPLDLDDDG